MKNFCYKCGCHGTLNLEKENVKHKLHNLTWRAYEHITILVDLDLVFCQNCGNTPLNTEDISKLDKAMEKSIAINFLSHIKVKNFSPSNLDFLSFELEEKTFYEDVFSFWSILHNNNIDKDPYLELSIKIINDNKNQELSYSDFINLFQNQMKSICKKEI